MPYKAGYDTATVKVEEVELKTGDVIKKRKFKSDTWKEKNKMMYDETGDPSFLETLYGPSNILSPNKEYIFKGNPSYGNFELTNREGVLIRKFQFSSDIQ